MSFDGILFDLDGTLWDSTEAICKSWNEVFAREGCDLVIDRGELCPLLGIPMTIIFERLLPNIEAKRREDIRLRCCAEENALLEAEGGRLYSDIPAVLAGLADRYRLAVVSNCQRGYIEAFMQFHGFKDLFSGHLSFGDTGRPKGKNIRTMIARLNLTRAVYVGDTETDSKAAHEAGIPFIFARYGFGKATAFEAAIDTPAQLSEAVRTLERSE